MNKHISPSNRAATCQDDFDPNSISVKEAHQRVSSMLTAVAEIETITIRHALNRTLASDVLSTVNVPPQTNSAMDGYALKFDDLIANKPSDLRIIGVAYAGKPFEGEISPGECIRIMTGAVIPESIDTVVMQENTEVNDNVLTVLGQHKKGQNIRLYGEDLRRGEAALIKGTLLKPTDIGIVASLGIDSIQVYRRVKAAVFSTGDELKNIGEALEKGQIYDSNRYTLVNLLENLGIEITDMGILGDDPDVIQKAFLAAKNNFDILITSGGVSVGDADYVKQTLDSLGEVSFWKIAMKPGRPLAAGKLGNTLFFGLPGNPVSTTVTFYQIVQPALRQLMGQNETHIPTLRMKSLSKLKKRPGRVEFQRGIVTLDENGEHCVKSTGNQGSHVLSSMNNANCFIILDEDCGNVDEGSYVEIQPFRGIIGL